MESTVHNVQVLSSTIYPQFSASKIDLPKEAEKWREHSG